MAERSALASCVPGDTERGLETTAGKHPRFIHAASFYYLFVCKRGGGEDPLVVATLLYMPGDERKSSLVFGDVRYH